MPHGVKIMPHRHLEDRVYTVISGVFYIGRQAILSETRCTRGVSARAALRRLSSQIPSRCFRSRTRSRDTLSCVRCSSFSRTSTLPSVSGKSSWIIETLTMVPR